VPLVLGAAAGAGVLVAGALVAVVPEPEEAPFVPAASLLPDDAFESRESVR
jgi:hypothetical protein